MKIRKVIIFFIFLILFILFMPCNKVKAYTCSEYYVDINVGEDNVFDVIEKYTVRNDGDKYSCDKIVRNIPLTNPLTSDDDKKSDNKVQITDINASCDYYYRETSDGKEEINMNFFDAEGDVDVTLSYKYNAGQDPVKGADKIFYRIVGNDIGLKFEKVRFKIHMPKEFDASKLQLTSEYRKQNVDVDVSYNVEGNTISGTLNGSLREWQSLVMQLELPDGYFKGKKIKAQSKDKEELLEFLLNKYNATIIGVCLACIIIAFVLWHKYGKDDISVETVEFYPPEEYNSAEVAFLYNGSSSVRGIFSLLLYLANKGYLEIEDRELNGETVKVVKKVKEYDGNNVWEKMFFENIFGTIGQNYFDAVRVSDLPMKLVRSVKSLGRKLNAKSNVSKMFNPESIKKEKWFLIMIIVILVLVTAYYTSFTFTISKICLLLFIVFLRTATYSMLKVFMSMGAIKENKDGSIKYGFDYILLGFILGPCVDGIYLDIFGSTSVFGRGGTIFWISAISIMIIICFWCIMSKRTDESNKAIGKIEGFINFLKVANEDECKKLIVDDPDYFYKVWPYAYALGFSTLFIERFDEAEIRKPDWYVSDNSEEFNIRDFGELINGSEQSKE